MAEIAGCIDTVLAAIGTPGEAAALETVKARVAVLAARHPLPYAR
jgi:glycine hydroxymethyltransferase